MMQVSDCGFSFELGRPLSSTLFPYTTLFRSDERGSAVREVLLVREHVPVGIELDRDRADVRREMEVDLERVVLALAPDRKSTRLNSSHMSISYAVFCLKKQTPVDISTAHV